MSITSVKPLKIEVTHVFLCHKCSGLLGEVIPEGTNLRLPPNHGLHGCGCISGWVRDWQTPVTIAEALADQAKHKAYMEKFRAEQEARSRE